MMKLIMTFILTFSLNISATEITAEDFIYFAKLGEIEKVKEAIEIGVDVNAVSREGHTALMEASRANQFEVARFLITQGADISIVSDRGYTALMIANIFQGDSEISEFLISEVSKQTYYK